MLLRSAQICYKLLAKCGNPRPSLQHRLGAFLDQRLLAASAPQIPAVKSPPNKPQNPTVLHITNHKQAGGAALVASRIAKYAERQGLQHYRALGRGENMTASDELIPSFSNNFDFYCQQNGLLDYSKFGAFAISQLTGFKKADILHLHNLHGGYFTPFALPFLTKQRKTVWTLHDMQPLTGHCAHSFSCHKWQQDCASCPSLGTYPEILVDSAQRLLADKKRLYQNSQFVLVTPSLWLRNLVAKSILQDFTTVVIPNGADEKLFLPRDKDIARRKYGIETAAFVICSLGFGGTGNVFKNIYYVLQALNTFAKNKKLTFLNIGDREGPPAELSPNISWVNTGRLCNGVEVSWALSAADIMLHPTLADNCPLAVIEAMACGLPVLSFAVGGVPELITGGETGYLVAVGDKACLQQKLKLLFEDHIQRARLGANARQAFLQHYTLKQMTENYLDLYRSL